MKIIFLVLLIPFTAQAKLTSFRYGNKAYVLLQDIAKYYKCSFTRSSSSESLMKNNKLTFYEKKPYFYFNKVKVYIAYGIIKKNNQLYISYNDLKNVLHYSLTGKSIRKNKKTIVIDPGHGGKDHGASKAGVKEKDLALSVALYTKNILEKYGYRVIMTRSDDTFISLAKRSQIAKDNKADVFLSIHANSVANTKVRGTEVFHFTPPGAKSSNGKVRSLTKSSNDPFLSLNSQLAILVHQEYLSYFPSLEDRGVRYANYAVLRNTACPSVLFEMGFVSNAQERAFLVNDKNQKIMALSLARALIKYCHSF